MMDEFLNVCFRSEIILERSGRRLQLSADFDIDVRDDVNPKALIDCLECDYGIIAANFTETIMTVSQIKMDDIFSYNYVLVVVEKKDTIEMGLYNPVPVRINFKNKICLN